MQIGDYVRHKQFGEGQILDLTQADDAAVVKFERYNLPRVILLSHLELLPEPTALKEIQDLLTAEPLDFDRAREILEEAKRRYQQVGEEMSQLPAAGDWNDPVLDYRGTLHGKPLSLMGFLSRYGGRWPESVTLAEAEFLSQGKKFQPGVRTPYSVHTGKPRVPKNRVPLDYCLDELVQHFNLQADPTGSKLRFETDDDFKEYTERLWQQWRQVEQAKQRRKELDHYSRTYRHFIDDMEKGLYNFPLYIGREYVESKGKSLAEYSDEELREACRAIGVPVEGSRRDLLYRLMWTYEVPETGERHVPTTAPVVQQTASPKEATVYVLADPQDVKKGCTQATIRVGDRLRLIGERRELGFPYEVSEIECYPDKPHIAKLVKLKPWNKWYGGPFAEIAPAAAPHGVQADIERIQELLNKGEHEPWDIVEMVEIPEPNVPLSSKFQADYYRYCNILANEVPAYGKLIEMLEKVAREAPDTTFTDPWTDITATAEEVLGMFREIRDATLSEAQRLRTMLKSKFPALELPFELEAPPRPEPMFGEADAGIQQGLFGEQKEVRVPGKGVPVQASFDDLLKQAKWSGEMPEPPPHLDIPARQDDEPGVKRLL